MLYTITVVSPEVEDFDLELQIESDATFADLHRLVRESCGWEAPAPHPATFYICDDRWHRRKTIPEKSLEDDTMDEVELGDFLEDEGDRLQYLFDPENSRRLLLEVSRIAYGKHIDAPFLRRSHGTAPALDPLTTQAPLATTPGASASLATTPNASAPLATTPGALASGLNASLLAELNAAALASEDFDDDDPDFEPNDDELFDMDEIDAEGFDFTEE